MSPSNVAERALAASTETYEGEEVSTVSVQDPKVLPTVAPNMLK